MFFAYKTVNLTYATNCFILNYAFLRFCSEVVTYNNYSTINMYGHTRQLFSYL